MICGKPLTIDEDVCMEAHGHEARGLPHKLHNGNSVCRYCPTEIYYSVGVDRWLHSDDSAQRHEAIPR